MQKESQLPVHCVAEALTADIIPFFKVDNASNYRCSPLGRLYTCNKDTIYKLIRNDSIKACLVLVSVTIWTFSSQITFISDNMISLTCWRFFGDSRYTRHTRLYGNIIRRYGGELLKSLTLRAFGSSCMIFFWLSDNLSTLR